MTEIRVRPRDKAVQDRHGPQTDRIVPLPNVARKPRRRYGGALFGGIALALLVGGVGMGAWRHYQAELAVAATAQQSESLVPEVRVAAVRASERRAPLQRRWRFHAAIFRLGLKRALGYPTGKTHSPAA